MCVSVCANIREMYHTFDDVMMNQCELNRTDANTAHIGRERGGGVGPLTAGPESAAGEE